MLMSMMSNQLLYVAVAGQPGCEASRLSRRQAAIADEEKRLYEGSYPDVRAVVDALFEVQPDLYFVQVGAHAGTLPLHTAGR